MEQYLEVLQKCPLFQGVAKENLKPMLGCLDAKIKKYKKGQMILSEGDKAQYLGIVLTGAVHVLRVDYYGNRSVLAAVQPRQMFAEAFACGGVEYIPVDVVAVEPSEVMMIDANKIIHTCSNVCDFHNQIIFNLLKVVAQKNVLLNQKIEITSKRKTREKLMTYLLLQAKANDSSSFEIPYDRQTLADYLEVDRSGLSVEISKLCKEGIINNKKNWFELLQ